MSSVTVHLSTENASTFAFLTNEMIAGMILMESSIINETNSSRFEVRVGERETLAVEGYCRW